MRTSSPSLLRPALLIALLSVASATHAAPPTAGAKKRAVPAGKKPAAAPVKKKPAVLKLRTPGHEPGVATATPQQFLRYGQRGNIAISAQLVENQEIEARLARFVHLLQAGDRAGAARLLSSRVPEKDRKALLAGQWFRRNRRSRKDFDQLVYWSDLQIRTNRIRHRDQIDLELTPRIIKPAKGRRFPAYIIVPMQLENGSWKVALRPSRTLGRVASADSKTREPGR